MLGGARRSTEKPNLCIPNTITHVGPLHCILKVGCLCFSRNGSQASFITVFYAQDLDSLSLVSPPNNFRVYGLGVWDLGLVKI